MRLFEWLIVKYFLVIDEFLFGLLFKCGFFFGMDGSQLNPICLIVLLAIHYNHDSFVVTVEDLDHVCMSGSYTCTRIVLSCALSRQTAAGTNDRSIG